MKSLETKILIIGIGNGGRRDDGLGWAFLDHWENLLPRNWDIEYRYHLQIEDAQLIASYDRVYFVDADKRTHKEGFLFIHLQTHQMSCFTTHELSPGTVLHLSETVYGRKPAAFLLGISGSDFQLKIGLSEVAIENLTKAIDFFACEIEKVMMTSFPDLRQFSLN